ncbi:tetratricopeptide repeat protein [Inhella crocodyli]|uniref:Tetratricopeptide repeat protein n=1 Tax=Inhella crocodyli TaxID=2499851 RepID=A0A3S2UHT8_9BURK|nr:tetratricopeptide repeat protein [Inhella crocodyli]RVT88428.1 tetratricopeptide repeat protein [Inhella crocodyli]
MRPGWRALHWCVVAHGAAWTGRWDRALRAWHRVVAVQPDSVDARASRAWAAGRAGQWALARDDWEAVVTASPQDAVAQYNLGFVCDQAGQPARALACFEAACALDPRADRAWYGRGLALVGLGRWQEALQAFEVNAQLQPISPYGWTQIARVGHRLGLDDRVRTAMARLGQVDAAVARAVAQELAQPNAVIKPVLA